MKAALFAVMALSLALMWNYRHSVLDAYTEEVDPVEIRFAGVALDFEKTSLPPSPYVVHSGVDTRRRPISLLFTEVNEEVEVAMTGGDSTIAGWVRHDGPSAAGGVVRLERHTSDGVGVREVPVSRNGKYSATDLPGGRYRIRAWIPGAAAMTTSEVFFLEADTSVGRNLDLQTVDSTPSIDFVDGGTMYVGLNGSFGVSVSRRYVNDEGVIVSGPLSGAYVEATFTNRVQLLSPQGQRTDGEGLARYRLRCRSAGPVHATVTFGEQTFNVALPACRPIPPTTQPPPTQAPSDSSTAGAGGNGGQGTRPGQGRRPGQDGQGGAATTTTVAEATTPTTKPAAASTTQAPAPAEGNGADGG